MMLALRNWNVSACLSGDSSEAAVEAAVRQQVEVTKLQLPKVRGQLADMRRGYPLQRRGGAFASKEDVDDLEHSTMEDIRSQRQSVLSPLLNMPSATVLGKRPQTWAGEKDDAEKTAEKEWLSQAQASNRAKKQRHSDIVEALVKPKPPRKTTAGLAKPTPPSKKD